MGVIIADYATKIGKNTSLFSDNLREGVKTFSAIGGDRQCKKVVTN